MATDSQGSTFVFASATYTVTSVTVTPGGDLLDNSHLGLASGSNRTYQSPALLRRRSERRGVRNRNGCRGVVGLAVFKSTTYTATVSASSVAYSVGELVRQSLTFKVKS
jgi:hypothetical protein